MAAAWIGLVAGHASGQVSETPVPAAVSFEVGRTALPIEVDGALDEAAWADALVIPLSYEWFPGDNVEPPVETEALVTYDDRYLYVGFRAFDPDPSSIRAHLMDRDQIDTFVQDDHVLVMIDTFNDERRAFQFRVNPLGVQADAVFSEVDGIEDFSWDIIWSSAGRIGEHGYEVEIALPFNQLRFPRGPQIQTWGFDLSRSWPRTNRHRIASWPRSRDVSCLLCQINKVSGFEGLEPGRNLEFDPTLIGTRTDTREDFPEGDLVAGDEEVEAGITARWGMTPNLVLNATLNPDFSQVEADVAQLDVNERFALFYEERRPFFLEGVDFFSTPLDAVFTRTVVDPGWGLKVTGKEGRNALGVFAAEDEVNSLVIPSNQGSEPAFIDDEVLAGVLRYRRDVGRGSTLGVLYTGREGEGYHNRVGGLDGFLRLSDVDTVEFQYLRSDTLYPAEIVEEFEQESEAFAGDAFRLGYDHVARDWFWSLEYEDLTAEFRADSGFIPRVDLRQASGIISRRIWGGEGDWYNRIDLGAEAARTEDHDGQLTDEELELFVTYQGPLQSLVNLELERNTVFFDGVLYDNLDLVELFVELQPGGAVKLELFGMFGDTVDFSNNQPADELLLNPAVEAKIGRHVNLGLDHVLQRLDVADGRLFEANLTQMRLVYNFNVRTFVRAIFQWLELERDPELFLDPVESEERTLFTQLLFSYKLNPRTVLFVGYTDSRLGLSSADLTQTDRTFFLKIGYAWVL